MLYVRTSLIHYLSYSNRGWKSSRDTKAFIKWKWHSCLVGQHNSNTSFISQTCVLSLINKDIHLQTYIQNQINLFSLGHEKSHFATIVACKIHGKLNQIKSNQLTLIDCHHLGSNERKLSTSFKKNLSSLKFDESAYESWWCKRVELSATLNKAFATLMPVNLLWNTWEHRNYIEHWNTWVGSFTWKLPFFISSPFYFIFGRKKAFILPGERNRYDFNIRLYAVRIVRHQT